MWINTLIIAITFTIIDFKRWNRKNAISVVNPSDVNNNRKPAPYTNTLILQNEGTLNNLTPAPTNNALLQNEGALHNETPDPPNTSLPQNEGMSHHNAPPSETQMIISNDLSSDFASESTPPTFEKFVVTSQSQVN